MMQIPGINLRSVQDGDLAQVANLDRLAFAPLVGNAEVEQEWYGGTLNLPDRHLFLAVEQATDLAVGAYAQLALDVFWEQQLLPTMGIAAVAVAPHKRGQRIARFMLEHALESARSRQLPLMMLYPFQHGFYRSLGWAWVGCPHQYRVSTRHLPVYPERLAMTPYDADKHQGALKAVYHRVAGQQNGWLQRREWQWQSHLKPAKGKEIYCYVADYELMGYVILQFAYLDPSQTHLAVIVQEWVALNLEAYRGILGLLASLRDQISTIVWNTHAHDPFPHLLKEQRRDPALPSTAFHFGLTHPFGQLGGGFMWRLVDLAAALRLRPIQPVAPFTVTFQVHDPVFGDSMHTVAVADGVMQPVTAQSAQLVVKTSIEHLTAMFAGVRRATELQWTAAIAVEGNSALLVNLDQAWAARSPFCWDFF